MLFTLSLAFFLLQAAVLVSANIEELSPEEFRNGILEGKFDVVIDVRRPEEWAAGHVRF